MRLVFTIRDWLWLCVVMALAIGWGIHVRYSTFLDINPPPPASVTEAEWTEALTSANKEQGRLQVECDALSWGIQSAGLTPEQKDKLEKAAQEFRHNPMYLY